VNIVGKTRYIKNLKESVSLGRQLGQTYLIIFSLIFPQLITLSSVSSNVNFKPSIFMIFAFFLFAILEYLRQSSTVITDDFDLSHTNTMGIVACMNLSFLFCSFILEVRKLDVYLIDVTTPYGYIFGVSSNHIGEFLLFMFLWIPFTYLTSIALIINPYKGEDEIEENMPDLFKKNDLVMTFLFGVLLISLAADIFVAEISFIFHP